MKIASRARIPGRARRRGAWRNGAGVCGGFCCRRSSGQDLERTGAGEPGAGENDRSAVGAGLSPALELQPLDPLAMTIARLEWRSSRHDSGPGPAEEKDKKLKAGSGSDATCR